MRKQNIIKAVFGSHLYGLNTPQSDVDYKGIYLPTMDELLLHNYDKTIVTSTGDKDSKNTNQDEDYELVSLPKFIDLCCKTDTMAMDLLHATENVERGEFAWVFDELVRKRSLFYSKNMHSLIGYLKHQSAKYGVKGSRMGALSNAVNRLKTTDKNEKLINSDLLIDGVHLKITTIANDKAGTTTDYYEVLGKKFVLTMTVLELSIKLEKWYLEYGARARLAKDNKGIDWKALSHALRAGYQVIDIFEKGDFDYPLAQNAYILDVKNGKLDFDNNVKLELELVVDKCMELSKQSKLPEKSDRKYWDDWLLSVYDRAFKPK